LACICSSSKVHSGVPMFYQPELLMTYRTSSPWSNRKASSPSRKWPHFLRHLVKNRNVFEQSDQNFSLTSGNFSQLLNLRTRRRRKKLHSYATAKLVCDLKWLANDSIRRTEMLNNNLTYIIILSVSSCEVLFTAGCGHEFTLWHWNLNMYGVCK
jgi:hypothetical protein